MLILDSIKNIFEMLTTGRIEELMTMMAIVMFRIFVILAVLVGVLKIVVYLIEKYYKEEEHYIRAEEREN